MLATKQYAYNLLRNDAALVALLGSVDKILYAYPNDFNALPVVCYLEQDSRQSAFYNDVGFSDSSSIVIDIWANDTTTPIATRVDEILTSALYTREYAGDVPDPDTRVFHKTMRFRRTFTADDLD